MVVKEPIFAAQKEKIRLEIANLSMQTREQVQVVQQEASVEKRSRANYNNAKVSDVSPKLKHGSHFMRKYSNPMQPIVKAV